MAESRNPEGKTPLALAIEYEQNEVALALLKEYPDLNLERKDSTDGNTVLHVACIKQNLEVAKKIYENRPLMCLK